jgi:trehalose 6-phosphate synthase
VLECVVRGAVRFVIALVLGLGLVAWAATVIVHRTTSAWFEKDLNLRAQLAVNGARQALLATWRQGQPAEMRGVLEDLTHDERIMAAAACSADLTPLTQTKDYPGQFSCRDVGPHLRPAEGALAAEWTSPRARSTLAPSRSSTEKGLPASSCSCTT